MRHLLVCILLSIVTCRHAPAQSPYRYFNNLNVKDGLSNNKVNCLLQDRRGFLWIGTNDGLNRFDGKHFTIFRNRPHNTATISGNRISDMLEDEDGLLWIATSDGGLTKYDYRMPASGQFTQYKYIPGDSATIPVNIINALVQDKAGYLWLASSGRSVIRFNKKTGVFTQPVKKGTKTALSLFLDASGVLWVGREGGGLLKIDTRTLAYQNDENYNNLYAKLPHAAITSLYGDKQQNIWYGSWDKIVYRFNNKLQKEESFKKEEGNDHSFNEDDARDFTEDGDGNLWIAGRYKGLHIYDLKKEIFYNYQHDPAREGTIADNQVNCLFKDSKGLIWLGTEKGVSIYNPAQQFFIQTFLPPAKEDILIYDFYKEGEALLIGTSNGIYIQDLFTGQIVHRPIFFKNNPLAVTSFYKDGGQLYIGTDYSVFLYEPATNTIRLLPGTEKDIVMNKIIDSRVVSMLKDSIENRPVLLASPYGHYIAYYDLEKKTWVSRMDSVKKIIQRYEIRDNLIRKFYQQSNGTIWLATAKSGLAKWIGQTSRVVTHYENDPSKNQTISNNNVYDIAEDPRGNLYVSTYGGGLNYFNTRTSQFFHLAGSSNLLEGISIDGRNNVWMITNGNLEKYNPSTQSFTGFTLPDIAKSGGVRGNIYRDNKNGMYAAGLNFFIRFEPARIPDSSMQPITCFTDFRIFNVSYGELMLKKNIVLKYNQNYFTIEFAAPAFFNGEVQYEYMLENFDKEWVDAGTINTAGYSNLEAGNYVFKVRATNKKGDWDQQQASLIIRIRPPFWRTWWFYLLCAIATGGAVYGFYLYRINELTKRQAMRNKIAQDLHDNVGSTLSSISVYSQVAQIYNEQQKSQDLKGILEKIGTASVEMIGEMSDTVWAINPRNDNMETILQRMESFARPLLAARGISFDFTYNKATTHLNLEMSQRKNFYLIFKEAVNNALKYSGCSRLKVLITTVHQTLCLEVSDNGKGFEEEKLKERMKKSLSGNGLTNMRRRAAEMKGTCTIASEPGKGTTVTLRFPLT